MGTSQCVFFMDNAPVHDKMAIDDLCAKSNQKVEYNAPYSPELNPIENFFGIWKQRVMKE